MSLSVVELFQKLARNQFGFFERLQTVAEFMTTKVATVDSESSLSDLVGRRDPATFGSLAVIDSAKRDVIGLLKQTTLLRCLPRYLNTLKEKDRDSAILSTNVCDLASRRFIHVSPSASPLEALETMFEHRTDCLLVYDDPHDLRGMISIADFARIMLLYYHVYQQPQQLQRLRLIDLDSDLSLDEIFCRGAQTSRDVMRNPLAVSAQEPVAVAIRMMEENDVRQLPVLNEKDQASSVISLNDILIALHPPCNPKLMDHSRPLPLLVDLLSDTHDPVLSEPVSSVARGRLISVSPTTRLTETLAHLLETGRDTVVVQDNDQLQGSIALDDVARVFRTLMRLQIIKSDCAQAGGPMAAAGLSRAKEAPASRDAPSNPGHPSKQHGQCIS